MPRLALRDDVFIKRGKNASAIYDLGGKRVFRITNAAASLLENLGTNPDGPLAPDGHAFIDSCKTHGLLVESERSDPTQPASLEVALPAQKHDYAWLEVTNRCNHRCLHCFVGDELGSKDVPLEKLRELMKQISDRHIPVLVLSGGEPLLHRQADKVISIALAFPFSTVQVLTNGTVISDALLEQLRDDRVKLKIPLFGPPAIHDQFVAMQGSYAQIIKNLNRLRTAGVAVKLTTTITNINRDHIEHIKMIAREFGLSLSRSPVFPVGFAVKNWDSLVGDYRDVLGSCAESPLTTIREAKRSNHIDISQSPTRGHDCQRSFAIQSSGRVTPCLMIRDDRYSFGSFAQSDLQKLFDPSNSRRTALEERFSYESKPKCGSCELQHACKGGGCPATDIFFSQVGPVGDLTPEYCEYPDNDTL